MRICKAILNINIKTHINIINLKNYESKMYTKLITREIKFLRYDIVKDIYLPKLKN